MSASNSGQGPAILTDERPAWPGTRGPVPGLWRFFASELKLVFGRPRNRAMLAVLAVLPIGFGILFRLTINSVSGSGGNGPPFLNELAGNGVFLALVVLTFMLSLLLLPLAAAVVAGDAIAGEAALGTLRGLLTVPAGRVRLLAVKYAAMVVYCLAACLVAAVVSLIMGLLLFPAGPVTTLSGTTIALGTGVLRVLVIAVYSAAALASLGAIGLADPDSASGGHDRGHARSRGRQRDRRPGAAAVGHPCLPADPLLAVLGRAVPGAGGLVGRDARAAVVRRLPGYLRRRRVGAVHHSRHHQLTG
jgi:hypothetical protein